VNGVIAANLKGLNGLAAPRKGIQKMGENFLKVPELREPLIPLSVLGLDLAPSTAGWAADLAARGFSVELDDVGRLAVSREVARQLMAEKRESEQKARDAGVARDAEFERPLRFPPFPGGSRSWSDWAKGGAECEQTEQVRA
jgi:hypothetical protein